MSDLVNLTYSTVIKGPNAFCLTERDGRLPLAGDHPLGLYRDDCRHLRAHELLVCGRRLRLLVADDGVGTVAVHELTNPDLALRDGSTLAMQTLRVRIERGIDAGGMTETITLHSYAADPVELDVEIVLDADFRPMLEIRDLVERHEREVFRSAEGDTLAFVAIGLDGVPRTTRVSCEGATAHTPGRLLATVALGPGEQRVLEIRYALFEDGAGVDGRPRAANSDRIEAMAQAAAEADEWFAQRLRLEVDEELVDRVLRRSLLDLRVLCSELDGHRYYAAGIPWYATLFGRDAVITALQALPFDPDMAESTLRLLAGRLGSRYDDEHDEEPGKVLHELRPGEIARLGLTPLTSYYGTVDATPLFLCLLCEHADWIGSLRVFRDLRPQVEQALRWMDEYGDLDGDGLLEYRCRSSRGLVNQGWKDSWDGVPDEHGVPLRAPIALVEVQGYAMRAKRRLARLFELDGDVARAEDLRHGAARIAGLIEQFWLEEQGFYAIALDADKRPSRALASNQGHLLWALAVPTERAAAIRDALMGAGSYSGWGVRTLSSSVRSFNPIGYHSGTIWPHDNALFAMGLRKYGFNNAFLCIFDNLIDAATHFPAYRLPELFAGYNRRPYEAPVPYPVACRPQAWSAGALPSTLTAGLGLVPDGLARKLRIRRPSLPRDVSRLALRGLRVADARVDLLFQRVGRDAVALTDVQIDGQLDVVLEIPPGCDPEQAPSLAAIRAMTAQAGRA